MTGSIKGNSVPAAELMRNFGRWQDRTAHGPVFVTNHGRQRVVLMSIEDFERIGRFPPATSGVAIDPVTGLLLDRIDEGFVAFDDREIVRRINTAAALYFRRPAEEVVGLPLDQLADPTGNAQSIGYVRRAISAGEVGTFDMASASYPGEIIRVQIFPFPGGGACLFRNVTPQRRAAEVAAAQSALSDALDSHGGVIHARLRTDGAFAEISDSHARRLGLAAGRMAEYRFLDLLGVSCRAKARVLFDAVVHQGQARAFNGRLLVDGIRERAVRVALAPIHEDFAIDGVMLAITE
jgi:prevent-host-death family protein